MTLQSDPVSAIKQQLDLAIQGLSDFKIPLLRIPLHQLPGVPIIYRSAIAFQLAPVLHLPSLDLAAQIVANLALQSESIASPQLHLRISPSQLEFKINFNLKVIDPGWIELRLTNHSLAVWLQKLTVIDSAKAQTPQNLKHCFSIQYAHARCCSLLKLAHQQGLIVLKNWQVIEPHPIPWLDDQLEASTEPVKLRLGHPTETQLIARFWWILAQDNWDDPQKLKAAMALADAWEVFYKHCRIWGEVQRNCPKLAQARLGLMAVTQQLLRSLQADLGIPAPVEL